MTSPSEILEKYWGYKSFRTPQKEIISSVLRKQNTIALLPTGSGKSICYQIPALALEGICLVVSPLLALMQDQIKNLNNRNIKATYIKSGSRINEIIALFDNIKFGNYKFLYLSPERLQSNLIQQKLLELNISLIAIDEAHCISEWGHDFRPSYRNINQTLMQHPNATCIALTATANKKVLDDIVTNLEFKSTKIFKKSFFKENLAYQVFSVEDKLTRLKQIFTKTKRPAIVYVTSRKKTEDISKFLNSNGFKSSFYHGGLPTDSKKQAFENWMNETSPIMVATNAFGMGIDKSNVGLVIHYDLPNSIENYVQESGRAGRNSKKSFAVLLHNKTDIEKLKNRFLKNIPDISEIKEVHKKLYQNFEIAFGEVIEKSFYFDTQKFSEKYNFNQNKVSQILQILSNNGIIQISNSFKKKSTIQFVSNSKNVLSYAINNIYIKKFINSLLRIYSGLYKQEVYINEFTLAKKNNITSSKVIDYLNQLHRDQILEYNPVLSDTEIQFLLPREDDRTINVYKREIEKIITQKKQKVIQFLNYLEQDTTCRSIHILNYFDEKSNQKCGICDVCLSQKKEFEGDINLKILSLLSSKKALTSLEINTNLEVNENELLIHLRNLLSENKIKINSQNKYEIKKEG